MGAQLVKGRRAQHLYAHGQIVLGNQIQQWSRQGPKADIGFVRSGRNQQDIDAITGERGRQIHRIVLAAELAFHATMLRQRAAGLRIAQCLPRPGQHTRIIAGDFQRQVFQASAVGIVVEIAASPAVEQGFKGPFAPALRDAWTRSATSVLGGKG